MDTLTNIDCPQNSPFLAYHEKGQMLAVAHGSKIILISTKNIPLYSGGAHISPITTGLYD